MPKPESKPVVPALPDIGIYGPMELETFKRFNREKYQETYGEQAPPWDKSRNIKRWFDTEVLDKCIAEGGDPDTELTQYLVFDQYANPKAKYPDFTCGLKKIVMTVRQASQINLPGLVSYPKYVVEPSPAQVVCSFGEEVVNPYNANQICSYEDAVTLAKALGMSKNAVAESEWAMSLCAVRWNGETRRPWVVTWTNKGGQVVKLQASFLIAEMYRNGVGAPGKWSFDGAEPNWISDQVESGEQDPRPEVPIPCRQFADVERWHMTPFGTQIYRTDIPNPILDAKTPQGGGGGGLAPDQSSAILQIPTIAKDVKNILKLMTA